MMLVEFVPEIPVEEFEDKEGEERDVEGEDFAPVAAGTTGAGG
jgi:hypothetical protein